MMYYFNLLGTVEFINFCRRILIWSWHTDFPLLTKYDDIKVTIKLAADWWLVWLTDTDRHSEVCYLHTSTVAFVDYVAEEHCINLC